jgi:RNA polymerase sigma-70 factor (ECF subfamily)
MTDARQGASPAPDETLLEGARRGHRPDLEELFHRHFGMAYRVAHRLLGHDQDAQDAVQDAFLKAVVHLNEFDGRSGFRTWLLRIVTNAALDLGRRRRRRSTVPLLEALGAQPDLVTEDPARNLHSSDLRRQIDTALDQLSPAIRASFVLFAEAELSYKEIAEIQKVPVGTIMSRLHFARRKLQASLDGVMQADSEDQ